MKTFGELKTEVNKYWAGSTAQTKAKICERALYMLCGCVEARDHGAFFETLALLAHGLHLGKPMQQHFLNALEIIHDVDGPQWAAALLFDLQRPEV